MEHVFELVWHALKDTLPTLPWLFLMYIVIQLLENKASMKSAVRFGGKLGPIVGSATGLIPQCGVSVMVAKFFEKKYITVGTLLSVFFATSDEAFILMLSSGEGAKWVLPIIAVKMCVGIGVGYAVDGFLKCIGRGQVCLQEPKKQETAPKTTRDIFMKQYLEEKEVDVVCSCGRSHGDGGAWKKYLFYPLLHVLRIGAFIFAFNFLLSAVIHGVGENTFANFMHRNRFLQPFIACLVGLIPNCASSVIVTQAFLSGSITFGSCVAGLCANAGMGFVVLLKNTKEWKRNCILIVFCYVVSVLVGLLCNAIPALV